MPTVAQIVTVEASCMRRSPSSCSKSIWYTTKRRSSTPGRMGIILVCKLSSDERLQIPFGLRKPGIRHGTHLRYELMAQGTGQLHHACCARLTPFTSSIPSPLILPMIQGTGAVWMGCGGACAVLVPPKKPDSLAYQLQPLRCPGTTEETPLPCSRPCAVLLALHNECWALAVLVPFSNSTVQESKKTIAALITFNC